MADPRLTSGDPSSTEALLRDQRTRWGRGERVPVEAYLAEHPHLRDQIEVVLDLVFEEVRLREDAGERPSFEEYRDRLPQFAEALRVQFEFDRMLYTTAPTGVTPPAATWRSDGGPASPSPDGFFDELARVGLLTRAQEDEAAGPLRPRFPRPRDLADELVRRRWLTAFQAEALLNGQGRELVVGPYRVLTRLGSGGMGEVFLARHHDLERLVALKVLPRRLPSAAEVERFRREARAVARLNHPHIATLYEVGEAHGAPFLALEYVPGQDLHRVVRDGGPLPAAVACAYARQAALGLHHAHERGLVHRDVKPSNLMLTADPSGGPGHVKVLDFGLARLGAPVAEPGPHDTPSYTTLGTPDFMAPEQIGGARRADLRADVYGLGATLYFLLAGQVPFPADSVWGKLVQRRQEPAALESHCPGLPAGLGAVVRRMMAQRPEDRYPSAAAVADALAPFTGEPVPAPPPRPYASRRLLLGVGAAVVLVALAVGLWAAFSGRPGAPGVEPGAARVPDPLPAGSEWSGTFRGHPPNEVFQGVIDRVAIEERDGERFRGRYLTGSCQWWIEGNLRGEDITWKFTRPMPENKANMTQARIEGVLRDGKMELVLYRGVETPTAIKLRRDR